MRRNLFTAILIAAIAIILPMSAHAVSGDVGLQVATLLGSNISIQDNGDAADAQVVENFIQQSKEDRSPDRFWNFMFFEEGYYVAEISCYKRNDARCLVLHTISKTFMDGSYKFHSANYYIYDGKKLMPVKDLPCNMPLQTSDLSDGLGFHNYMHADKDSGPASKDEWNKYTASSNLEYRHISDRKFMVTVHNATPSHRFIEFEWKNDKFLKRPGPLPIIHASDFAGFFLGDNLPAEKNYDDVKLLMQNESIYIFRKGTEDIARIEVRKGAMASITIISQGYTTSDGIGVGTTIDPASAMFVARHSNDTFIDDSGIQYKIDGNNVCREITLKNQ